MVTEIGITDMIVPDQLVTQGSMVKLLAFFLSNDNVNQYKRLIGRN
ncbi:MAG: hypothetical protein NZ730_09145 [Porticoccaceae bacterium]|nr:hypothetical protein [Porticoccaceae bacterium]